MDSLELSPDAIAEDFSCNGGSVDITVESAADWTATFGDSKASWVTLDPSSGKAGKTRAAISVAANSITADRSVTVKFTSGHASRELLIRQRSADVLSCSLSCDTIPAAGGSLTLRISSTTEYSLEISPSCSDWVKSVDVKAIDISSHHFEVAANLADEARTGGFVIKSRNGTQTVPFTQKGDNGSIQKAEGYVRYSDGSPASDVVVSDGFHCVKTDAGGYYRMYPTSDCRYVYISFPSDSKISLNGYGQPDFFKEYKLGVNRYDFTLQKAPVEEEFTVFAMADPQCCFMARGRQKIPDTDRFRLESVPAMNKVISETSTPCYGITLGDIVHSVNQRNTVAGMPIMRDIFKQMDMPVFQTMGNHDFTYFYTNSPLQTDERSSTLNLKAQRAFEDVFGPVNYSFNRGKVHIVCMKDIIFDSATDNTDYHCGFSDEQYQWLLEDLAQVSKDKMVIFCVHIPLATSAGGDHRKDIVSLLAQYTNSTIFSGHMHCSRTYTKIQSTYMTEHIHQAVCGELWYSNLGSDGCPNGYTVYHVKGDKIVSARLRGVNGPMADPDCQMRIYRGGMKTGGPYAYFQWKQGLNTLMINVFNGSKDWTVQVYENGEYTGDAKLMDMSSIWFSQVEKDKTYDVNNSSSQDWWTIGCHVGYYGYGTNATSFYGSCYHMFRYTLKDPDATVKVVATDMYGQKFECSDITTECYPDYVIIDNVI